MQRRNVAVKIALVLVLSGGIVFFHASRPVQWARARIVVLLEPIMRGASSLGRGLGRSAGGITGMAAEQLTLENERLTAENFDREKLAKEVQSLEAALGFRDLVHVPLKGARVLLYTHTSGRETLLIDQGALQGIKKGDMVVDEHGTLVGEVSDTGDDAAGVLIASNPGVTFPVVLPPAGAAALARGIGARTFSVELIPRGSAVRRGDFVARAIPGMGGHERTVLVGIIVDETPGTASGFMNARATLLTHPELLDYIFIIPSLP